MKEESNVIKTPFNLYTALRWWKSDNKDCKGGHFDVDLYLKYLSVIYKKY